MSADEDDPTIGSAVTPTSHIPLAFRLKVAKEVLNSLTPEEKKRVNDRREEDWKKLYKPIPDIKDEGEREKKLLSHHQ